jgi:hypothetical protein
MAEQVMRGELQGSSVPGEHPKFATRVDQGVGPQAVIVKFSPPRSTAVGQRWSDLLVAEHVAHRMAARAGLPACESEVHRIGDRTYLEVVRFDREGAHGRVGVTSLLAVDAAVYGRLDSWIAAATRLQADGRIDGATREQIRLADTFGALIGNTDRHFGNLAFYDDYTGRFSLAPIYDMLPMLFAPHHDEVMAREFVPPYPTAETIAVWPRARVLAEAYWHTVADDERVSDEFRAISRSCARVLEALPRGGVYGRAMEP